MSTVRSDNYANRVGDKSVPAETVVNGTAKAWINHRQEPTATTRKSFNISSVTNIAVGRDDVSLINSMSDANYGFALGANREATNSSGWVTNGETPTASVFRMVFVDPSGNWQNARTVSFSLFGDPA